MRRGLAFKNSPEGFAKAAPVAKRRAEAMAHRMPREAGMPARIRPRPWAAVGVFGLLVGVTVLAGAVALHQYSIPASGAAVQFIASEDTHVRNTSPATNYGQRSTIEADTAPSVKRALMRFNISGIPSDATVTLARLRLFVTNGSPIAGTLYSVNGAWSEATTTWSNAPALGAFIADIPGPPVAGIWVEAVVTAAVTGNGQVDLYLTTTSGDGVDYSSSEAGSNPPTLVVDWLDPSATPTPTPSPPPTPTPTPSPTLRPTETPTTTPTPTPLATPTPTDTPTPVPTPTPIATPTPSASPGPLQTLTFIPTEDAYIRADVPDSNYGSATTIGVDGSPIRHFLMKFSISGLNGRQPVSVKLRLYNTNESSQGGSFHRLADNTWSESSVTWNNAPASDAAAISSLGAVSPNTWYETDLTPLITGDGIFSLRADSASTNGADYSSSEGGFAPQLLVTVPSDGSTPTPTPIPTPTLTPAPGDAVLVGAGDISSCSNSGDEATATLLDGIAGTVFTLGDTVYQNGTTTEFNNCYHPTWGRHKARTRPSVGNHEYQTLNAAGYYGYFGAAAGDPTKGYYSYNLGSWHVVVLNSNCAEIGGCQAGSAQEQWLRADLAANPSACTLAYWHHPRFSSGSIGNSTSVTPFWQALYEYGAEVVLSGHAHDYERFAPQDPAGNLNAGRGIVEFVVGTGGIGFTGTGTAKPNSLVFQNDTLGVLKLTLHPSGYDFQFVPVAGRTFTDSGQASCH